MPNNSWLLRQQLLEEAAHIPLYIGFSAQLYLVVPDSGGSSLDSSENYLT